jgi:hypothetical protein
MIKSKIEAREEALRLASETMGDGRDIVERAKEIEAYLIGDSDLPERAKETDYAYLITDIICFLDGLVREKKKS